MSEHDYDELGFMSGLEIHQQLEGKKLFCNCPTEIRKEDPDFSVDRRLRASAGESGDVDRAAQHEVEKGKLFTYQGYEDITCLVELDEEPPRSMNRDALRTALQVCKMLHADIVDQIQVMRKIVVDGSNPSGFQRTALIGRNGYVEIDGKKIGIDTICLEEEACQVMERTEENDVYNLSRQGIPLIEIATDPDIESPEEAKEVAGRLGMILRSTGKVKRGLGSIRQDVNISIKDAGRIEIKGFQDLKSIPKVIDNEIERQLELMEDGEEIEGHVRKAEDDNTTSYLRPMPGAARMYPETDIPKITTPSTDDIEVPKLLTEKREELEEEFDLPDGYGKQLMRAGVDFEDYSERFDNIDSVLLAEFFIKYPKDLKSREGVEVDPEEHVDVLEKLDEGVIPKSAISEILLKKAQGEEVDYSRYEKLSDEKIEEEVKKAIENDPDAPVGALMGQIMGKLGGKVEGERVMKKLKELKSE